MDASKDLEPIAHADDSTREFFRGVLEMIILIISCGILVALVAMLIGR